MKIAASTYSYNRLLVNGTYSQLTLIEKVKEMGFDAIEFVEMMPHDGSTPEEYAVKLRNECERVGLEISNYTFGADFINGCGGDTRAEIERVKKQIDIAELLGAKSVRHDATVGTLRGKTFEMLLPTLAEACREITEYAAQKGIKTTIENHSYVCQDSSRVEKLVTAVNHPNFGLLCDMGNFLCADEDPAKAFGIVASYAFYVHAKDFHIKAAEGTDPGEGFFRSRNGTYLRGAIVGQGNVPIKSCLYALKRVGYDGMIAIEFEGMEDNIEAMRIGLANLRRYTQEVGI